MSLGLELNPSDFGSNIFSIETLTTSGVANEIGLVIPDYQRDYTWEEPEIKRLVSDILASIAVRSKKPSGNFFGATVWCKRSRSNEIEFNIPSYDIVDGQQRITSCLLLTICLCLKINENYAELANNVVLNSKLKTWLENEIDHVGNQAQDMVVGSLKRSFHPFPRLIHEEDIRGKSVGTSEYHSPLALIQLAFDKALTAEETNMNFDDIKVDKKYENVFERLKTNISHLNQYLDQLSDENFFNSLSIQFTDKALLGAKNLKDLLLGEDIPQSEYDKALADEKLFEKQIRLLQFCGHFFKATCFSVITTGDEDAAFSIFDSLNTTGVPLTAIETLKPYIMREYKHKRETFEGSEAGKNLKIVDEIIRAPSNSSDKQNRISKELAIHTALVLDKNTTLNNDLNAQRIAMREIQRECSKVDQINLTSEVLKNVAEYRQHFTFIDNIRKFQSEDLDQNATSEVKLINAFLANTGTKLYRPILTRFFYDETGMAQYHEVCKALAAFYVLRRGTSSDTDRIDDIFRSCMKGTETFQGLNLNCSARIALTATDLVDFKNHLKALLSTSQLDFTIKEKEKWVDHVKEMTHFKGAKFLLRFMLFAAHDGAKIDKTDNTLLQREDASPDSSTAFLNFSTWDNDLYETLEHIAPQNEKSVGWKGVYDDPKLKDMIGNFVLLPKGQNSALQDDGWDVKKLFLETLLCDSTTDRKNLVSARKAIGTNLPPSIVTNLLSGNLVKSHMLAGLDNVVDWDADYIKKRSERLVSLVWDKMILWLS